MDNLNINVKLNPVICGCDNNDFRLIHAEATWQCMHCGRSHTMPFDREKVPKEVSVSEMRKKEDADETKRRENQKEL